MTEEILLLCAFRLCHQNCRGWLSGLVPGKNVKMRNARGTPLIWEAVLEEVLEAGVTGLEEGEEENVEDLVGTTNPRKQSSSFELY